MMQNQIIAGQENDAFDNELLSMIDNLEDDMVVEDAPEDEVAHPAASDEIVLDALEELEELEETAAAQEQELEAESVVTEEVVEAAVAAVEAPKTEPRVFTKKAEEKTEEKVAEKAEEAEKTEKVKVEKKPKAEGDADKEKTGTPRVFYGKDAVKRIEDKLGTGIADYAVLTISDTDQSPEAAIASLKGIIDAMNIKEKNRAVNLIEWVSGKRASLNNVIDQAIRLLVTEKVLQTGDKGNLFAKLTGGAKGYSPASARAMGNNTISVLKDLKFVLPTEKRANYALNPESVLLQAAAAKLGIQL